MRRARFLALVATTAEELIQIRERTVRMLHAEGDFRRLWTGRRTEMFVEGPGFAFDGGGFAGHLFARGGAAAVAGLSAAEARSAATSRGRSLIDSHWGGYVALVEGGDEVALLRSPLGDLPCLLAEIANGSAIASDPALLAAAGHHSNIDVPALARHLAAPDLRRGETCLTGITELQGGLRLIVDDRHTRAEEIWSPWQFATPDLQVTDKDTARDLLRNTILSAVEASASLHRRILLRLSGGLDSSIVAASLAHAGVPTVALNLVTDDAAGDERAYAREAACATTIDLVERTRRLDHVDLHASTAEALPRPSARAFIQASLRHATELAEETGADALFDGGGGDNVFCSLQSMRPVVDCLCSMRGASRAFETARSVATLSQVSQLMVMRRALSARVRGVSGYSFPLDTTFLSPIAVEAAHGADGHRWLEAPPRALPGKAAHIGLMATAQSVVESFDPGAVLPIVSPLISQPVVETCASIPSWLWYERGHNRAVARAAFTDFLPAAIAWRRSKGGPDGFIAELYRTNRSLIARWLEDGALMAAGLLDRTALHGVLAERGPVKRHDFIRILQLVDAESWVRSRRA